MDADSVYFRRHRGRGSRGLKIGVRGGQVEGRGAGWGGVAKHLPTLLRRWKNLSSHLLIDGCLSFFTDLEGIALELWRGRVLKHRMIFLYVLKRGPFFAATCFLHSGLPRDLFGSYLECKGFLWIYSSAGAPHEYVRNIVYNTCWTFAHTYSYFIIITCHKLRYED